MMAFEVFTGRGIVTGGDPAVSIRANGSLGLNRPAVEACFKDTTHARMLYDPETRRVGIRPVSADTPRAYKMKGARGGGQLNAQAFIKHYGLRHEKARMYRAVWDAEATAQVFDLNEAPVRGEGG